MRLIVLVWLVLGALLGGSPSYALDSLPIGNEAKIRQWIAGNGTVQGVCSYYIVGINKTDPLNPNNASQITAQMVPRTTLSESGSSIEAKSVLQALIASSEFQTYLATQPDDGSEFISNITHSMPSFSAHLSSSVRWNLGAGKTIPSTATNVVAWNRPAKHRIPAAGVQGYKILDSSGSVVFSTATSGYLTLNVDFSMPIAYTTNAVGTIEVTMKYGTTSIVERFDLATGNRLLSTPVALMIKDGALVSKTPIDVAVYEAQVSTNLQTWTPVGLITNAAGGSISFPLATNGASIGFYRLMPK